MNKWFIYNKKENLKKLWDLDIPDIQKVILANRDIVDPQDIDSILNPSIDKLHDPFLMKDMDQACDFVFNAMLEGRKITIVGDYDQDGVAATVILLKGLRTFYPRVDYLIPDRIEDGYGLNEDLVDRTLEAGSDLIITCDNGISAYEAISYARKKGVDVVVTDHHKVFQEDGKDKLPEANYIINPQREDDSYPMKGICGATVAYKFINAIYDRYGEDLGLLRQSLYDLLQFAALGTVADVMDLVDENRAIVVNGLEGLNNSKNLGLNVLLNELSITGDIDIFTIGFIISPTINASGRLYTAELAVELFMEEDLDKAREYARKLIAINKERKDMTLEAFNRATDKINSEKLYENDIIILYDKNFHESICGLVAGRIKERYNKPALVLTDAQDQDKDMLKGSGRSIESYDMYKEFSQFEDDLLAFGGHKMACGLSIEKDKLKDFSNKLLKSSTMTKDDYKKSLNLDLALGFNYISFKLIDEISELEPFSQGFDRPLFGSLGVQIKNAAILGQKRNVLKFDLYQNRTTLTAISFDPPSLLKTLEAKFGIVDIENNLDKLLNKKVDIVYQLTINKFNGNTSIQLKLEDIR